MWDVKMKKRLPFPDEFEIFLCLFNSLPIARCFSLSHEFSILQRLVKCKIFKVLQNALNSWDKKHWKTCTSTLNFQLLETFFEHFTSEMEEKLFLFTLKIHYIKNSIWKCDSRAYMTVFFSEFKSWFLKLLNFL